MTCIVALRHKGTVWMGADSASVGGLSISSVRDPKIYRVGGMLIGFTTSWRMGQLLGMKLKLPDHDLKITAHRYLATAFIDAVRDCLKAGGFAKKENEVEHGGTFLVAYRAKLYRIDSDYQVSEPIDPFSSVGCGFELALGSLATTHALNLRSILPRERITLALKAAAQFSAGVRAPFLIEELK